MTHSSRSVRPHALEALIRTCHDVGAELWLSYRVRDGAPCLCRLLQLDGTQETWVGGAFAVPADQFLFIGATRERRDGAIRLDNCAEDELAGLLQGATIPFALGWSAPSVEP